ncbi:2-hydroxy-3-keto-5-methylthiopentenyl-1-phosphate phosphatase [Macrococcus brunensis]|uniref:2-hydroxy-3-keto-5-methylthiopentenyl-1-phosphate phosphatase n=1 Tax=Macrococcus brunensis TaxID=198483 RepID=A0A4R6BE29_9STAP|nr:MtnX-like HAD-IB family phosphatase [Macrococcus brunensis]TDL97943.1 2-hydroxy-3-keto-5-methylthiopentenyl-1-phosphate phosphatase [Macrococcus brunensis]
MGYIIACDFDGTVTASDTIIAIMQRFAPTDSQATLSRILDRTLSIQEGVTTLFNLLDTSKRQAIVEFVRQEVSIRPGFQTLLDKAQELDIPFYIISGGMHFFIDPILSDFTGIEAVYANNVDFSGEKMLVEWRYPCDDVCASGECGTCKPSIVRTLGSHQVIAIGDSVTDIRLAEVADILFTTDKLTTYAEAEAIPHIPFQTFYDIVEQLEEVVR